MSVKRWLVLSMIMFMMLVVAGYVVAFHSGTVSTNEATTNLVLGVAAISLFGWPICLARALQTYLKGRSRR